MGFNNTIRQLTTDDTNHASNFNEINNKLLENDVVLNNSIIDLQGKNIITDLNDLKTAGKHCYFNSLALNKPPNIMDGTVSFMPYSPGFSVGFQLAYGLSGMAIRNWLTGVWQPWIQIATMEKTDIIPANIINGWTQQSARNTSSISTSGRIISIDIAIGGGVYTNGTVLIQNLPTSIRPSKAIARNFTTIDGTIKYTLQIDALGQIQIWYASGAISAIDCCLSYNL